MMDDYEEIEATRAMLAKLHDHVYKPLYHDVYRYCTCLDKSEVHGYVDGDRGILVCNWCEHVITPLANITIGGTV